MPRNKTYKITILCTPRLVHYQDNLFSIPNNQFQCFWVSLVWVICYNYIPRVVLIGELDCILNTKYYTCCIILNITHYQASSLTCPGPNWKADLWLWERCDIGEISGDTGCAGNPVWKYIKTISIKLLISADLRTLQNQCFYTTEGLSWVASSVFYKQHNISCPKPNVNNINFEYLKREKKISESLISHYFKGILANQLP